MCVIALGTFTLVPVYMFSNSHATLASQVWYTKKILALYFLLANVTPVTVELRSIPESAQDINCIFYFETYLTAVARQVECTQETTLLCIC